MATLFGQSQSPADGAAAVQSGPIVTVTPPASMTAGQLVVVAVSYRGAATVILRVNNSGGQAWSQSRSPDGNPVTLRLFWCTFNGTWDANPSFKEQAGGTLAMSAWMHVFTPGTGNFWVPNTGPNIATYVAGSTPFTKTINGITTVTKHGSQSHVAFAAWVSGDDNTWGTLAGTNWSKAGLTAQLRNTIGNDCSMTTAYQIQTASGATNNVSQNQASLGGDPGATIIMSFTEVTLPTGASTGAQSWVQDAQGSAGSGGSSLAATLGAAVASGNGITGYFHYEDLANGYPVSIVDNQGNEYFVIQKISHQFLAQTGVMFFRPNITNGPTTITATLSAAETFRGMMIHEVANLGTLDKYNGTDWVTLNTSSSELMSVAAVVPASDGTYLMGGCNLVDAPVSNTGYHTVSSPFSLRETIPGNTGSGTPNALSAEFVQTTAASVVFSVTANLGRDHLIMVAAFRPAASPAALWRIPTTAANGTARKLFVFNDTAGASELITNVTVTASSGVFEFSHNSAVAGTYKPAILCGFGANDAAAAFGGPCWVLGVAL